jgi:crotonobetainyl-CoA:carnitine CoA-transferase CaiB-like acyl-CoA transferase
LTNDPHLKAVKLIDFENHPTEGRTAVIRSTIQVDGHYASARSTAVPCGWDTNDLLQTLGYEDAEIETLIAQKAVYNYEK